MHNIPKSTINQDSYLYAVHQAQEARTKPDGSFQSHLRYEPFLMKTWNLPKSANLSEFKKTLVEILQHHFQILPSYKKEESISLDNLAWFSLSIATLFADIESLLLSFTGSNLPKFIDSITLKQAGNKSIGIAIKKFSDYKNTENTEKFELFPLVNEEINMSELFIQEFWSLLFSSIQKTFGAYADLFVVYAKWKYSQTAVQESSIDWSVRPPCGPSYRRQFKELFDERRNSKRPEKTQKEAPAKHNEHKKEKEQKHQKPKPASDFTNGTTSNQLMEEALKEVKAALKKLKESPNISEISLKPQNSFVRRHQHEEASKAGFETESVGEGASRCVNIKQKDLV